MPSILVDSASRVLLAASPFVPAIVFVNECTLDSYHVPRAERPNYRDNAFFDALTMEDCTNWTWKRGQRAFHPTPAHVLNEDLRARARLAGEKARYIAMLMGHLSTVRSKLDRGVAGQEMVYRLKAGQAQRFKDSGYNEADLLHYPYVMQYADMEGISLKQAADDILLKAEFDGNYLLSTEGLRLQYFRLFRAEKNPDNLPRLLENFMTECFTNKTL